MSTKIFVVVREDQNEHGFVDTSIERAFTNREDAQAHLDGCEDEGLKEGTRVGGRQDEWPGWDEDESETEDGFQEHDWEVCFNIHETEID